MSARPISTALGALGAHLRELREQAGLTGTELASALGEGWRQPKVSKIETGRQLPTEPELSAWADLTGAESAPLFELRARAAAEYGSHEDRLARAGGVVAHQADLTALKESCGFLAEFQPALVPAYLQTAAYMRGMAAGSLADGDMTSDELQRVIAEKIRRQAVLYEPGREIVHVMTEAALRLRIGTTSTATMRGQLVHLAELADLPGHTLGVLPFATACPVPPSGFALLDRDLVRVETVAGVLQLAEPDTVARYSGWLDQLLDVALTGDEAAEFCRQVADELPG